MACASTRGPPPCLPPRSSSRLLVVLSRSPALKPLRAPRALAAASSPVAASKAASKSYKAARTLGPAARLPSLPSSKRLKAAFAAASLLRLLATAAPVAPSASPAGVFITICSGNYHFLLETGPLQFQLRPMNMHAKDARNKRLNKRIQETRQPSIFKRK